MALPQAKPGVMQAPIYVAGNHVVEGVDRPAVLSANENPLGPSAKALAAYRAAAEDLHRYPDGAATELRAAIGRRFGLDPERIVVGAGSDELITMLMRAYAGPGDEVLYSRHGFAMYPITALTVGATPVAAPEAELTADVDALLAHVTERTRLVFLANPNNPTGSYLSRAAVRRLRAGLPEHVVLVLDAAYAEYVERNDYDPGIELVDACPNVVMLRTFSKIFGLAALRLGWGYFPAGIAQVMHRVRSPFNVSVPAQMAGIAAVEDTTHSEQARAHNALWLPKVMAALEELGLEVPPSVGNFVLAGFPDEAMADRANAFLLGRGVIVRGMKGYGLGRYLRITIGAGWENGMLIDALKEFRGQGG